MTFLPTFAESKLVQFPKTNDTEFSLQLEQESFIVKPFFGSLTLFSTHWLKKSERILQISHCQSRSEIFSRHLPFEPAILLFRKNFFSSGVKILAPILGLTCL